MAPRRLLIGDLAGPVLAVVPHPDDESLGCGGLLALLGDAGVEVAVVAVTDGNASHPGSRRWPAERLATVRRAELREALTRLGLGEATVVSLGLPDGAVPDPDARAGGFPAPGGAVDGPDAETSRAIAALARTIDRIGARTVVAPWRRDAHADHRASHALVRHALRQAAGGARVRLLEYAVWEERATPDALPRPGEAIEWELGVETARARKAAAVAAHRSQCGEVVDDAPDGFVLSPAMRERACGPVERYREGLDPAWGAPR